MSNNDCHKKTSNNRSFGILLTEMDIRKSSHEGEYHQSSMTNSLKYIIKSDDDHNLPTSLCFAIASRNDLITMTVFEGTRE